MIDYKLPKSKVLKAKASKSKSFKFSRKDVFLFFLLNVLISSIFGFLSGSLSNRYFYEAIEHFGQYNSEILLGGEKEVKEEEPYPLTQEELVIKVVKEVSPAVVSIIVSKEIPIMEEYYYSPFEDLFGGSFFEFKIPGYRQSGTEKKEIGGGTGFIISEDGMVLTNKHVVLDEEAEYTVLTLDGSEFLAEILAKDPVQDIAILQIKENNSTSSKESLMSFPQVILGDSDDIKVGQTSIAIGYALGKYQNAISVGVISGLGRTITASSGGFYETLEDIIQTDAAINRGNSGGPLLNLKGEVIGINTAIDIEGQNIGFTIPINKAKRDIEQVKTLGKIVYPFLGVRYIIIDKEIQIENDLLVDYGALIIKGKNDEVAVFSGSAAEKAGLKEGDIILELDGNKITNENSLAKIIMKYEPQETVVLKILKGDREEMVEVVLGEQSE